jgi:hypothetical protein
VVSEDSDQIGSGFAVIHLLSDTSNTNQAVSREVVPCGNQLDALSEPREVVLLRSAQCVLAIERDHRS